MFSFPLFSFLFPKKVFYFLLFFVIGFSAFGEFQSKSPQNIVLDKTYLKTQSDAFYLKGEVALFQNKREKALKFFKNSLFYAPESLFLRKKIAQIYLEENLFAEAIGTYKFILQQNPTSREAREHLARIYATSDLEEEALEQYSILIHENPKDFSLQVQKSVLLLNAKKWKDSLKSFKKLEVLNLPRSKKLEVALAQAYIYEKLHQFRQKEQQMRKAESYSDSLESVFKIAKFYIKNGDVSRATSFLKKHQKKEEFSVPITKTLFSLYKTNKNQKESLAQLEKLNKWKALEPDHYFDRASFLIQQGEEAQAIPFLKDFLVQFPSSDLSRYLLGALHEKNQQIAQAVKEYRKVPTQSLYFIPSQLRLSQIYYYQGHSQKALSVLHPFVFKSKTNPELLLFYSQLLWEGGDFQESIDTLTEGLKLFADHEDILFLRGVYLYKQKPSEASLEGIKAVVAQNPFHAEALNFLAYTYAERNIHLSQAEKLVAKAISLKPESEFFLDTMGWVLYKKKSFKEALIYLEEAFSRNKQEKSIVEHLAKTYYELKEFKKAEAFSKKKMELDNGKPELKYEDPFFTQAQF